MAVKYTKDELSDIRSQAVFSTPDVRCPRHSSALNVVRTFAHHQVGSTVRERAFDAWPAPPDWVPDQVHLVCQECQVIVPARTGPDLQEVWRNAVGRVREGLVKRGRDPAVLTTDERYLKVSFELPTGREEKVSVVIAPEELTFGAEKLAAMLLDAYDRHIP